jgi:hypothetical protein
MYFRSVDIFVPDPEINNFKFTVTKFISFLLSVSLSLVRRYQHTVCA